MQQFNQPRTYAEGENMPITEDGVPGVVARNGGVYMKRGGALRSVARRVQAAGSGEDKILVHINPAEYKELVRKHGPAIYNESTGLPQLGFFKKLGKILKVAAPIILSVALPGLGTAIGAGISGGLLTGTAASALGGAILGAGTNFVTSGGKFKGTLKSALLGGLGGALQGASSMGGLSADEYKNLTFAQKAMVGNRLPGFFNATDPAKAVIASRDLSAKFLSDPKFFPNAAAPSASGLDAALDAAAPSASAASSAAATPSSSFFDFVGKSGLTKSVLDPAMRGFGGFITSPLGIGGTLLAVDALKGKGGSGTSSTQTPFPTLPNQVSPGNYANAPNITAPTLQQMAPLQQTSSAQQGQQVRLPDGRVVPAAVLQNAMLQNYAAQQNEYSPFTFKAVGGPVYARTGGLAQVKRYDEGGTVTTQSAPFVPTRRVLTAPELEAQGMDWAKFGERPRSPGMQSFFTPYSTAPTAPPPGGSTPGGSTPGGSTPGGSTPGGSTPGGSTPGGNFGDDTTETPPGGRTPVGPTTTDQYGTTRDSQGTVISANVDTSQYWDPVTGQYKGNWRGIDQYLIDQEAARTPIGDGVGAGTTNYSQDSSQPEYFDSNYFDQYSGLKKGGALNQLSRYVRGQGDGQADKIPAMLSDGEYVMDAETVSAIGNGSSEAGAKMLDKFRMNLRKHKRSAPVGKIPPKTKNLSKYMSGGSR